MQNTRNKNLIFCLLKPRVTLYARCLNMGKPHAKYSKQPFVHFLFTKPKVTIYVSTRSTYSHNTQTSMFQQGQPIRTILKRVMCLFTVHWTWSHSVCFNMDTTTRKTLKTTCCLFLFTKPKVTLYVSTMHNYMQHTQNNNLKSLCMFQQGHT